MPIYVYPQIILSTKLFYFTSNHGNSPPPFEWWRTTILSSSSRWSATWRVSICHLGEEAALYKDTGVWAELGGYFSLLQVILLLLSCVNLFLSLYFFFLYLEWCFTIPMFLHMSVLWFRNPFLQFHVPTETMRYSLTSPSHPLWREVERRIGGTEGEDHGLR